tara:strand:+ start:282 stop:557 length:276 start_codon:yes stop_codon:yes gene_type:complete
MAKNQQIISGSFFNNGEPFHVAPFNTTSGSEGIQFFNNGLPYSKVFNISLPVAEEEESSDLGFSAVMGVAVDNVSTVMGVTKASISKVMGV